MCVYLPQGPYGNFTLQEFVGLAEHLLKSSKTSPTKPNQVEQSNDAVVFDEESPSFFKNVGTAKLKTVSSSTSAAPRKPTSPPRKHSNGRTARKIANSNSRRNNRRTRAAEQKNKSSTATSEVPLDLSNYSKPSKLDIVLPEFIVDHVESYTSQGSKPTVEDKNSTATVDEVIESENNRAADHDILEVYVQKAVDAMKSLEDSYKFLYEQIEQAKKLFSEDDPTRKTLDDILVNAATPSSILGHETLEPQVATTLDGN